MKTSFTPCHMCGSLDNELVLPAMHTDQSFCFSQKICLCRNCGLLYKNPVVPQLNKVVYSKHSWSDSAFETVKHNAIDLGVFLSNHFSNLEKPKIVLEIGPGHGLLSKELNKIFPKATLLLCEPSEDVARSLSEMKLNATILPCSIDELDIFDFKIDFIVANGVDYLFENHRKSINKIYSMLKENSFLYIERNVFTFMNGYVNDRIKNQYEITYKNDLITTWFHEDQYKEYFKQWFSICKTRTTSYPIDDEVTGETKGLLLRKDNHKSDINYYSGKSWYKANKEWLDMLEENNYKCVQNTTNPSIENEQDDMHLELDGFGHRLKNFIKKRLF